MGLGLKDKRGSFSERSHYKTVIITEQKKIPVSLGHIYDCYFWHGVTLPWHTCYIYIAKPQEISTLWALQSDRPEA